MRKALAALLVTAVAVVLLAGYDTKPPRTFNPNSALRPPPRAAAPDADAAAAPARHAVGPGPLITTPFSVIQVQATVHARQADRRQDAVADRRRPAHPGAQRARRADPARARR